MKSYTCKRPAALVINDIVKLLHNSTVALREGGSASHYLKTRGNEEENNGVTERISSKPAPSLYPKHPVTRAQWQKHWTKSETWERVLAPPLRTV